MAVERIFDINNYEKIHKIKKVCAYARVSTDKDTQQSSFNLQVKEYTQMIMKNPRWDFAGVYADEGKSGTNIFGRKQFMKMIEVAKAGGIDLIITKSISRFARNTVDCLRTIRELKKCGTEIFFENDNLSSFDPSIDMIISALASIAEEESKNNSQNVKWRYQKNFKEGKVHMVTSKMLGFDRDEQKNIIINKDEAVIVRKIYNLYLEGYSHEKIANYLNELGYKTKANNKTYYAGAVQSILSNEKYTGDAILQKTIRKQIGSYSNIKNQTKEQKYYVENSHPGIIDRETWNQVQDLKKSKARHYLKATTRKTVTEKARNRTIYNGLAKCDVCGSNYQFKRNNINRPNETRVLTCKNNKYNKKCANDIVNADPFDEALLGHINSIIRDKSKFFQRLSVAFNTHPEVIKLLEETKALEGKIKALEQKIIRFLHDEPDDELLKRDLLYQKAQTEIDLAYLKNKIITTYDVDKKILYFKNLLRPYKKTIENLEDFPIADLFNYIVIKNRNKISFGIAFDPEKINKTVESFHKIKTSYIIRKTEHKISSQIDIY